MGGIGVDTKKLKLQFSEEENNSPACGCKAAAATVICV
jgi:hypothetical protein